MLLSTNHWEPRLWHGGTRAGTGPGGSRLAGPAAPAHGSCPPALGVLEYRVLGTDFQAYAVVFTQLELEDEAFSTVELYSEWAEAGPRGLPPSLSRVATWGPPRPPSASLILLPLPGGGTALVGGRHVASHASPSRGEGPWGQRGAGSPRLPVLLHGCGAPPTPPPPQAWLSGAPAGRTAWAGQEAMQQFAKWSRGLGFLSQQRAQLQTDRECPRGRS